MNKLSPLDQLDPNNVGGREQMINRMYNHQTALLSTKPTIDSRKPPRPHVDANKKDKTQLKYKKLQEYGNVYATFRATQAQKIQVDTKVPITENFKSFWGKKNKAQKFQEYQHNLNLRSQKRRIDGQGTMLERKKNSNDPLAHPTYLLTSDTQPKTNNYLLKQILKPQKIANPVVLARLCPKKDKNQSLAQEGGRDLQMSMRPSSAKPRVDFYQKSEIHKSAPKPIVDKSKRPSTANNITKDEYERYKKEFQFKQANIEFDFVHEIPNSKGTSQKDYQYIKERTIQIIIKYRIISDRDLKTLFGRIIVHNQHMKISKLEEIFEELKNELDKQTDQEYLSEVPKTTSQFLKDYDYIRSSLLNLIEQYCIISKQDLKNLFYHTSNSNSHMSQIRLEQIYLDIESELEKQNK